jgi:hypothetical protein
MSAPDWLSLLSPVPADAKVERVAVASAEQIASGAAAAIAGWYSIRVHLSEPDFGLRHVLITLDQDGRLLSGGDHVMIVLEATPDRSEATLTEHESVGGRFEADGSFLGTYWKTILENSPGDDESTVTRSAKRRPPSDGEIVALRGVIDDLLGRLR